jgi:hypothetical protein
VLSWTNDYAPTMVAEQTTGLLATWSTLTNSPSLASSNVWVVVLPLTGVIPGSLRSAAAFGL